MDQWDLVWWQFLILGLKQLPFDFSLDTNRISIKYGEQIRRALRSRDLRNEMRGWRGGHANMFHRRAAGPPSPPGFMISKTSLFPSSPKPPNDLICPTFFCCQPPFTFTYFSIISCLFTHPYPFQKLSNSFFQIAFSLSPITFLPPSNQTWFILFKNPLSCFLNILNSFFQMLSNVFYPLWPHFFHFLTSHISKTLKCFILHSFLIFLSSSSLYL